MSLAVGPNGTTRQRYTALTETGRASRTWLDYDGDTARLCTRTPSITLADTRTRPTSPRLSSGIIMKCGTILPSPSQMRNCTTFISTLKPSLSTKVFIQNVINEIELL